MPDSHGLCGGLKKKKTSSQEHRTQGQKEEYEDCRTGRGTIDCLGGRDGVKEPPSQGKRASEKGSRVWG